MFGYVPQSYQVQASCDLWELYLMVSSVAAHDFGQFSSLPPSEMHPSPRESVVWEQPNMLSYIDHTLASNSFEDDHVSQHELCCGCWATWSVCQISLIWAGFLPILSSSACWGNGTCITTLSMLVLLDEAVLSYMLWWLSRNNSRWGIPLHPPEPSIILITDISLFS